MSNLGVNRTTYNVILGKDSNGNVIRLDNTFENASGMRGATGSVFEIVPATVAADAMDNFEDYVTDLWALAATEGETRKSLADWIEAAFPNEDAKRAYLYDDSYSESHGDIREAYDLAEGDVIHCVGGGRIFPRVLDGMEWAEGTREAFEAIILNAERD